MTRRSTWQESQDRYYSDPAKHTHLAYEPKSRYGDRLAARMAKILELKGSDSVLEIGAGSGRFTPHLAKHCRRVVAADHALALLSALPRPTGESNRIAPLCVDAHDLARSLRPASFNALCGFFILHHLEHRTRLYESFLHILKPGARLGFLEPNRLNPLYLVQILSSPEMQWETEKGTFTFSAGDTMRQLQALGFIDVRVERFGFFPPFLLDRMAVATRIEDSIERTGWGRRFLPFNLITARTPGEYRTGEGID